MPKYTLHYFNLPGRGQLIRLLFHYAGVEFTDHRIEFADWPELKKDNRLFPFGQMPTLEVDGTVIAQTMAIARYLADEFGLAGKDNLEKARVNMIADGLLDLGQKFTPIFAEKDEAKKEELKKNFNENEIPVHLSVLERLLSENNGGKGYFVGENLTWVDVMFMDMFDFMSNSFGSSIKVLDPYPLLKGLNERVSQLPKIKAYMIKGLNERVNQQPKIKAFMDSH